MKPKIWLYGLFFALLLVAFKWVEYQFMAKSFSFDLYLGIVAAVFLGMGLWIGFIFYQRQKDPTAPLPHALPSVDPKESQARVAELGLSQREQEVLQLICEGFSNQEIADKLFISIHTVKTHVANLYGKLDVKRRTQAVQKAKELKIIG